MAHKGRPAGVKKPWTIHGRSTKRNMRQLSDFSAGSNRPLSVVAMLLITKGLSESKNH